MQTIVQGLDQRLPLILPSINCLGGNPVFTTAAIVSGGNNDKTKVYFASTEATRFLVGSGYHGDISTYSFKSLKNPSKEQDRWLKSAGGASGVDYFTTPSGFELRCSSCMTEACLDSNGNFIENDKGIPVDYEIAESLWYNRIALNAELDKLTQ